MDEAFQNFLNLIVVGALYLFPYMASASTRGAMCDTCTLSENCEAPHVLKIPANAYGDLPRGYQYFDVPGRGQCGYWAVLLGFEAAKNPSASSIELTRRDVTDRLWEFGAYVAHLRERDHLPLKVREAFEELAWDVACSIQKDAFNLTEGDWRGFFDALSGGGIPLDSGLIQFLSWWLGCDIIVMYGDGQEHVYSGIFPEKEEVKRVAIYVNDQSSGVKKTSTISEEKLQNSRKSEVADGPKDVEVSETSKTSELYKNFKPSDDSDISEEPEENESSENFETSDSSEDSEESEEESDAPNDLVGVAPKDFKDIIRVFYKLSEDRGHYWSVIPEQFQSREAEENPMGMTRISLYRR